MSLRAGFDLAPLTTKLWMTGLLVLALVSAFSIIGSTHQSRALYAQLQEREAKRWYLEEEYSRLLLEQSTWASHHRIADAAEQSLGLAAPEHAQTRLVIE